MKNLLIYLFLKLFHRNARIEFQSGRNISVSIDVKNLKLKSIPEFHSTIWRSL